MSCVCVEAKIIIKAQSNANNKYENYNLQLMFAKT